VTLIETAHGSYVAGRRARVIAARLAEFTPAHATVLDIGCGDGEIAWLLSQRRPDLQIAGVDVLVRDRTHVPVTRFDGRTLPFPDNAFDVVTFVDVLHHCDWPAELLAEACRVARGAIIIKDHSLQGVGAKRTLRFMDGVGNRRYGVDLPYNYLRPNEWTRIFDDLQLTIEQKVDSLGLYPWPFSMIFERRLHFLTRLAVPTKTDVADTPELLESAGIG
jgi:SAM-dependent methyltransferase